MQSTRCSVLLRFLFWGALIASPFAISTALTGLFYVLAPTLDTWTHADLGRAQATRSLRPFDDIVAVANSAAPSGATLRTVNVPASATESV